MKLEAGKEHPVPTLQQAFRQNTENVEKPQI
jgi:hypothetical protein